MQKSAYNTFTAAIFCPVGWVTRVTEADLLKQYEFYRTFIAPDKVYLESYRSGEYATKEQLLFLKHFFEERGLIVSGAITTTTAPGDIKGKEYKSQRLFETFCYTDNEWKTQLKDIVSFTAGIFDEIILDDYYFTNCTCRDCIAAKGPRSWKEYRLLLMKEVSRSVIVEPAHAVNPRCKVVIKYPNWMESFAETGYNPGEQKDMFDGLYTGTETRNMMDQDQNLPRYASFSLVRWLENLAPGKNGGGWFDAYQCYPMEAYLEQAYLTIFAKARELTIFCWPLVYDHYFVPTLGFQMKKLDALMSYTGACAGLCEYHPVNAQGEDHLADYLGLLGVPFNPTPVFPEAEKTIFLTAAALEDTLIFEKLERYVREGGHAIVTSGFVKGLLRTADDVGIEGIKALTSLRYRDRHITATHYQYHARDSWEEYKVPAIAPVSFPLMEHRNNCSWMTLKGQTDEKNFPILIRDTYGLGQMVTLVVPDNFSCLKDLPREVLTEIRRELCRSLPVHLDCAKNVGLFLYDNETFVIYAYEYHNEGPQPCFIHVKGEARALVNIQTGQRVPLCATVPENKWQKTQQESVFKIETHPDIFTFWRIER